VNESEFEPGGSKPTVNPASLIVMQTRNAIWAAVTESSLEVIANNAFHLAIPSGRMHFGTHCMAAGF
jgi:hypothetical protein